MTKLKIQINKKEDLLELQTVLNRMGLKFEIKDDDLPDTSNLKMRKKYPK